MSIRENFPVKARVTHIPGESGIWVFVFWDLGAVLVISIAFLFVRSQNIDLFTSSLSALKPNLAGISMVLLLISSLFVALSVTDFRNHQSKMLPSIFISLALICAAGYIFNRYIEWTHLYNLGLTPNANVFCVWFWSLTMVHLGCLITGIGCLAYMLYVSRKPLADEADIRGMESAGCIWHSVDMFWIILFPLLYLVR